MAKILLWVVFFGLFVGCEENPDCLTQTKIQKEEAQNPQVCPEPIPEPIPTPDPVPGPQPGDDVPDEALLFEARANLVNFDATDEDKLYRALEIIKKVVASREFRDRVINFTYQGKKQFVDNKGLSNSEIYSILLDGKEDLLPEVDHEMDLDLELYYSWRNTVGYTTPGALRIYMNTKYFDVYTPSEVAGNVFHEWVHKIGFDHARSYSVERDSSVPYALGYIIEELGKKYE